MSSGKTFMWVLQNPCHTSVFSGDWAHGIAYRWVQQTQHHHQQQLGGQHPTWELQG